MFVLVTGRLFTVGAEVGVLSGCVGVEIVIGIVESSAADAGDSALVTWPGALFGVHVDIFVCTLVEPDASRVVTTNGDSVVAIGLCVRDGGG